MLSFNTFVDFANSCTNSIASLLQNSPRDQVAWRRKKDGSRVSDHDLIIEEMIRVEIKKNFPEDGIMGEELFSHNASASYQWIIDPIDGTYSFTKNVPLFGTLIGLQHEGKMLYGYLRMPMLENAWMAGNGKTCIHNGSELNQRSKFNGWKDSLILTTDPYSICNTSIEPFWKKALEFGAIARTWGDCYGYYMVCLGKAELMADTSLKPFDILPLVPIITGSGLSINQLGKVEHDTVVVCSEDAWSTLKV